jgi:hypothetical protein
MQGTCFFALPLTQPENIWKIKDTAPKASPGSMALAEVARGWFE